MSQRNYPCDHHYLVYFGLKEDNRKDGGARFRTLTTAQKESYFKKQLYACMIGQAQYMRGRIEQYLAMNVLGIMTWQLNEIWPTGGWGSLEYGTPTILTGDANMTTGAGSQILGGRWKPLHYVLKKHLYGQMSAACGVWKDWNYWKDDKNFTSLCFVRNDDGRQGIKDARLQVTKLMLDGSTSEAAPSFDFKFGDMAAGPASLRVGVATGLYANATPPAPTDDLTHAPDFVLLLSVYANGDSSKPVFETHQLPAAPFVLARAAAQGGKLQRSNVRVADGGVRKAADSSGDYEVDLLSDAPVALQVVLTTRADGRFEDNAFVMEGAKKTLRFHPWRDDEYVNEATRFALFKRSVRVEDVSTYLHSDNEEVVFG